MLFSKNQAKQFLRFLISGLPSFIVAIPLNIFLVQLLQLHKVLAYCIVLLFQVTVNFFMLKRFAFQSSGGSIAREFSIFMSGILLFRVLDAIIYALLVQVMGMYYIFAQILNVCVFSVAKFLFSKKVFLRR